MTPFGVECKQDFTKPIYTADYEAKTNSFSVKKMSMECETPINDENYEPPFPTPVDTYKNAKPTTKSLSLTSSYNKSKAKSGDYASLLQGILFADMNYCLFNERTNDANVYLDQLKDLNPSTWGNIKPFDSPEYGKIVLRTVNREQSMDTLFALGAYIETSRLVFQSFTSDSKVLVHLKILKNVLEAYTGKGLNENQKAVINELNSYLAVIEELENRYTEGLRHNLDFDMSTDEHFIKLKEMNLSLYQSLVE